MSSGTSKFQCWPTSQAEAKRLGLTRYDNGVVCKRGHGSVRHISNGACVRCHRMNRKGTPSYKAHSKRASQKWDLRNPEKAAKRKRESAVTYYWANVEQERQKDREYRRAHPLKKLAQNHKRRANLRNAEGFFTDEDVSRIFGEQAGRCTCGKPLRQGYTIDHKTPISRGGSNWPSNIQLLCPKCNGSKGTKTDEEWRATLTKASSTCLSDNRAAQSVKGTTMPNILNEKYSYDRVKFVDAEGKTRHSAGNGDSVARSMLLLSADQIAELAEANDIEMRKYKNPGLAKMALASRLRALIRKGTQVMIGDTLVKKLDQKQPELKAPPKPRKGTEPDPAKRTSKRTKRTDDTEEVQDEAT